MMSKFQLGSAVRLLMPDNPRMHRKVGRISSVHRSHGSLVDWAAEEPEMAGEDWFAVVKTAAAGGGQIRALFSEMELLEEGNGATHELVEGGQRMPVPAKKSGILTLSATGEMCPKCGGLNMQRAGTCLCCQDCGETSGCS